MLPTNNKIIEGLEKIKGSCPRWEIESSVHSFFAKTYRLEKFNMLKMPKISIKHQTSDPTYTLA